MKTLLQIAFGLFLMFPCFGLAQNNGKINGFRGKRLSAAVELQQRMGIPTFFGSQFDTPQNHLVPGISLDYTISRGWTFGLLFDYSNKTILTDYTSRRLFGVQEGQLVNSGLEFGFHFKSFFAGKGGLAPIGTHLILGWSRIGHSGKLIDEENDFEFDTYEKGRSRYLHIGIGDQRIIFGFLTLHYGFTGNVLYHSNLTDLTTSFEFQLIDHKEPWEYMRNGILFNFHLGIGYLIH